MWIDQRVSRRPSRYRWLYNSLCPLPRRGEIIVRASLKAMVPLLLLSGMIPTSLAANMDRWSRGLLPRAYAIILAVFWVA